VDIGAVPGGGGILLSDQLLRPDRIQTILWRDKIEQVVDEGHRIYRLTGRADPAGQFVGLGGYDSEAFTGGQYILDISNCNSQDCSPIPVDGALQWSPDGDHSIYVDMSDGGAIKVGDESGREVAQVGEGRDPFWISNDTFGYIRTGSTSDVVSATLGSDPQVILAMADLTQVITDTSIADFILIRVATHPKDQQSLILMAGNRTGNQIYVAAYDMSNDSFESIFMVDVPATGLVSVGFSPDGRWVVMKSPAPSREGQSTLFNLVLYDMEKGEYLVLLPVKSTVSPSFGWSVDGRWLFQLSDGVLIFTAPGEMYQHLVLHGLHSCRGASWTNTE
jgi:hypothetical protein